MMLVYRIIGNTPAFNDYLQVCKCLQGIRTNRLIISILISSLLKALNNCQGELTDTSLTEQCSVHLTSPYTQAPSHEDRSAVYQILLTPEFRLVPQQSLIYLISELAYSLVLPVCYFELSHTIHAL